MTRDDDRPAGSIPGLLRQWAAATPEAPALLAAGQEPLTYRRLSEQVDAIAGQIRSLGIRPDDRVALTHRNGPELAAAFLGIASAAVCAPLNDGYRGSEFDFYLSDLRAKAIVIPSGADSPLRTLAELRQIPLLEIDPLESGEAGAITLSQGKHARGAIRGPNDTALVLHTSGTTARPKIVPLTHGRLVQSARNVARTLELTPDDRCLNIMPLFHIHALVGALLSSISAGAAVVCTPGFHAPSFHAWLAELSPTWYTAVPTMHRAIVDRADPAGGAAARSTLRLIRSSSAPLPWPVYDALEQTFGVPVIEAFGMTEAAHQVTSNPLPPGRRRRGSVGLPTGVEVAILDTNGRVLGPGETGEVAIRGETVFSGYESNERANDEAFVDGWFRTGDEGLVDEDGYVFLRGRSKEIINRAGEKVSPGEVEDALLGHPDVVQAVSFAVPDERLGEDVGAAVVLREGSSATVRELQERVADRLADFKVPSVVVFVDEVPTGPTGKLQRIGLAERLGIGEVGRRTGPASYVEPRSPFEEEIAELWASTLHVERVSVEDDFFSLGGDSILGAELVARIAERYGRSVPVTTLMWAPTLGGFCSLLADGSWDEDSLIVPVQTRGDRPPLFVTHGLGDEVLNIAVLKRTLGDNQPLYAVRARLDKLGYGSVEEMAVDYFREIQDIQPTGPYQFVGMCSGGAIVMELARCARSHGESVQLAAMIDPQADLGPHGFRHYARRTVLHARNHRLRWAISRKVRHLLGRLRSAPPAPGEPTSLEPFVQATAALRTGYRYKRVPTTLTVIRTMDYETPPSFWERYAETIELYDVPAPHVTIFQHPHADVLGDVLAHVLQDVDVREAI